MFLKLLVVYCSIASSFAWLPAERCQQGNNRGRSFTFASTKKEATVVSKIDAIATDQHEAMKETYKSYQFLGVPVTARNTKQGCFPLAFEAKVPLNCSFYTYDPELISSVACSDSACKLSHSVSTVASYTANEGYNWGVKISTKLSLFDKTFEIGGEVSTGGSYSCTYTKGRTVTDLVECSRSSPSDGNLHLYTVRTDMMCDFGKVEFQIETRNNKATDIVSTEGFSAEDLEEIKASAQALVVPCQDMILDTDKISERLLGKIMNKAPLFNPYTDLIQVLNSQWFMIMYYKKMPAVDTYRSIVPFTTPAGNSVFQYACVWTQ